MSSLENPDALAAKQAEHLIDDADELGDGELVGAPKVERFDAQAEEERKAMRELVDKVIGVLSEVMARSRGPHWVLTDGERAMIAGPAVEVMEKYDVQTGPEWRLALALGGAALPRLMVDVKSKKAAPKSRAKSDGSSNGAE